MKWGPYKSENINGNLHNLATYMNLHHPDAELVAVDSRGYTCAFIYREPAEDNKSTAQNREKLKEVR